MLFESGKQSTWNKSGQYMDKDSYNDINIDIKSEQYKDDSYSSSNIQIKLQKEM